MADQVLITPALKLCGASNRFLRCLSIRPGTSLLTDIDTASHVIERRIEKLPLMHRLWFHPSGYCLGYRKSGRIGNPSDLFFLNPAGLLLQSFQLADAVSEVEADLGLWYVGCRDSRLYAFEVDGRQLWRRRVRVPAPYFIPGMFLHDPSPNLHVGAGSGLVGVGAERRLYVLDGLGHQRWKTKLRSEPGTHEVVWGPSEVPARASLLERLGLPADADAEKVYTGFLRLEMGRTGPGLVRQVERYETEACAGADATEGEEATGFQVVIAGGSRDCITAVGIAAHQIAVGTQDGKLELFNGEGTLLGAFRTGDAPVSAISMDHCQLRASYAGGLLTMFDNGRITGFVILPAYFATLAPCGSEIAVWSGKEAWVVDRKGRVVWRAAFERRISSVVVGQVGFHVLAGGLFWFRRTAEEDPTAGGEQERGGRRRTAQHPDPETELLASAGRKPRLAGPAEKSKAARVLAMLARPEGASVKEIQSVTAWQPHTLRAFVSETARKRLGLPVISERRPDGERIDRLTQGGPGNLG